MIGALSPALPDPRRAHQVADGASFEPTMGDDAVVAASSRPAGECAAHGQAREGVAGGAAAGFGQFGGVEVGEADLDPALAPYAVEGFDAEAVAVADIDNWTAEGGAAAQLGRHAAPVGDARARVGQSRGGEGEGREGEEGWSDHPCSVAQETGR